jgi:hypothetical protein
VVSLARSSVVSLARSRQLRLAVAAGAAALLAAGCSASSGTAASGTAASGTAARSGGTGTTTATLTAAQAVNLAASHAQKATSFSGTFSVQATGLSSSSGTMTMNGTMSETIRPALLIEADIPTVSMAGVSVPGGISEIMNSSAVYLRMSTFSSLTGKPWIEVPLSSLNLAGVNFSQLIQQAQNNSALTQTQLLAHASDVRTVGTSTLNGVPVTEYTGTYSPSAALAQLHGVSTAELQQQLSAQGFTTADFQLWLDGQQQVRKLIVTEQGSKSSMHIAMTVTSINQPVSVQLPASSQVAVIPASALKSGS